MSDQDLAAKRQTLSETALRISERYGVPPEEVDAVITDRPLDPAEPHPMTIGALLKDTYQRKASDMAQPQSRWTPASIVGITLGILGILAIATLLVFLLQWNKEPRKEKHAKHKDTTAMLEEVTAAPPRLDSLTPPQEPLATTNEQVSEPASSPKPATRSRRSAPSPVLSTSNSLEAEERLAELRAAGNAKARITRVSKGGTTIYQVRR